jgi:hypothetical protein
VHLKTNHKPKETKTMKKLIALVAITCAAVGLLAGCTTYEPPEKIKSATATLNRYTPEYVREANKALTESNHPDAERLTGIGQRLETAIDSLDRWANETNTEATP